MYTKIVKEALELILKKELTPSFVITKFIF